MESWAETLHARWSKAHCRFQRRPAIVPVGRLLEGVRGAEHCSLLEAPPDERESDREGVDEADLRDGPGHYPLTPLPGQKGNAAIAGHRTTYLAPFAHIDSLKPGDKITFVLPYGTFEYEVTGHRIVPADDLAVLQSHHREELILQACHPRFFATHRYLAYAKLVRVEPRDGQPYTFGSDRPIA